MKLILMTGLQKKNTVYQRPGIGLIKKEMMQKLYLLSQLILIKMGYKKEITLNFKTPYHSMKQRIDISILAYAAVILLIVTIFA